MALVNDASVQNLQNADLILPSDISSKRQRNLQLNSPFTMHKNSSMKSLPSNMTLNVGAASSVADLSAQKPRNKSQLKVMQKNIAQALEDWNYDEMQMSMKSGQTGSRMVKSKNKMKNVFQLSKFAKSPSSAQIIYEEISVSRRDLYRAQGSMREEIEEILANRAKNGKMSSAS